LASLDLGKNGGPRCCENDVARREIKRGLQKIEHATLRINDLDELAHARDEGRAPRHPRLHTDAPNQSIERIILGERVQQRGFEAFNQTTRQRHAFVDLPPQSYRQAEAVMAAAFRSIISLQRHRIPAALKRGAPLVDADLLGFADQSH
jgi:hypothetical protein